MKVILLAVSLVLFTSPAVWACLCVTEKISEKEKIAKDYAQAAVVFTGRVVRAESIMRADTAHFRSRHSDRDTVLTSQHAGVRYTFAVSRLLKGSGVGPEVFVTSDNTSCGVALAVDSERLMYAYSVDVEPNLRGALRRVAPYYATDVCSRHQELRYTKAAERRQLRQLAKRA
ncbi:hypothetical protein [Hymenobacter sp.]|uniref:hypothetical protein n=1 Tax=Hymenobacter sp. TaxID=1898978 RepID=UPI00286D4FCC|nr:hypothetical protein [Hymenobacter sp.]